jgi:hypothetical protein
MSRANVKRSGRSQNPAVISFEREDVPSRTLWPGADNNSKAVIAAQANMSKADVKRSGRSQNPRRGLEVKVANAGMAR